MTARATSAERAAVVSLLRRGQRPPHVYAELIEEAGSALEVLERERDAPHPAEASAQLSLSAGAAAPDAATLAQAEADLTRWAAAGIEALTVLDESYPPNLRAVHDRPPLLFVRGALTSADDRAIAVIGSRHPPPAASELARRIAGLLARHGFTIVSGLAAGIDTAVHTSALQMGARTIAVLGTGLEHAYPPENRDLQDHIADRAAVVSQFWPHTPPSRTTFPLRNAVMSGLSLATVIVAASETSGTRTQARRALAHGRPLVLARDVAEQPWGRELVGRPAVAVIDDPAEALAAVKTLAEREPITPS